MVLTGNTDFFVCHQSQMNLGLEVRWKFKCNLVQKDEKKLTKCVEIESAVHFLVLMFFQMKSKKNNWKFKVCMVQ